MKLCKWRILISLSLIFTGVSPVIAQTKIAYSVAEQSWEEQYGNHRALIEIKKPSDAVHVNFLWRRHDAFPDQRRMMVINSGTGEEIKNIFRININNEECEMVFGPVVDPGLYYFYYLPYYPVLKEYHSGEYMPVENAPDKNWVTKHRLDKAATQYKDVSEAIVSEIQARNQFNSFYPMEVAATGKETDIFLKQHKEAYQVFPEDRTLPIRMKDAIPVSWLERSPASAFHGKALKNEYYALQLGVFASRKKIQDLRLEFSDLKDKAGNSIPAKAFTCFNTDGIDINAKPFTKRVNVDEGRVQPLWVGIDIPADAVPGVYESVITVKPANLGEQKIKVLLTIGDDYLADRGDDEPWRHSRLRWLNSTLGIDDEPVAPYTALVVDDRKISCLGRSVQLNNSGFPDIINSGGNNILAAPIKFVIELKNRTVVFPAATFKYKLRKNGIVKWTSTAGNENFTLTCNGEMEFDGRLKYTCEVKSKADLHIQDIRIELPLKKAFATYMIGMGRMGGFTPKTHLSRWLKTEDSFWIGETTGGVQIELQGGSYHGPLLNLYKPAPPASWFNGVNGGFKIDTEEDTVTASAYSGSRTMKKGQSVTYEFAMIITPVKEFKIKDQALNRYFHATEPTPEVLAHGGNVMNVHHANKYNPFINYPFIARKEMRGLVDKWHEKDWKVKIYYTVRELSNHLTEIWALRSLGDEVLADGNGGGYQWLQEHLVNGYTPQWYTHLGEGTVDAAILNGGESRWYNYYVEGLAWLVKNMDIDGLYLDDVSFDRRTLKRMRKVMEQVKPGCMIDLHSNTAFSLGSTNQNLELYPYIDKTWFGEGFNFDLMPADFWLTEVSGIPFGIGNDILMHMAENNKRGMVFGMTHRGFWPMWKLWDEFGLADSKMVLYTDKLPVVTTDNEKVIATTYLKDGKALVAIGSWAEGPVEVKLIIDWKLLGLKSSEVNILAPAIEGYQEEKYYKLNESIHIDSNSDCLLIISRK